MLAAWLTALALLSSTSSREVQVVYTVVDEAGNTVQVQTRGLVSGDQAWLYATARLPDGRRFLLDVLPDLGDGGFFVFSEQDADGRRVFLGSTAVGQATWRGLVWGSPPAFSFMVEEGSERRTIRGELDPTSIEPPQPAMPTAPAPVVVVAEPEPYPAVVVVDSGCGGDPDPPAPRLPPAPAPAPRPAPEPDPAPPAPPVGSTPPPMPDPTPVEPPPSPPAPPAPRPDPEASVVTAQSGGCEGDAPSPEPDSSEPAGGGCAEEPSGSETSGGGCQGDSTDGSGASSGGGCEGDSSGSSSSSSGGCGGESSSGSSSSSSGCEGDAAAKKSARHARPLQSSLRLAWPVLVGMIFNRRWRRRWPPT